MASQYDILPSWQHFTASHAGRKTVCEECPERPYLSLQVPRIHDHRVVVRRAVFTQTSSHQHKPTKRTQSFAATGSGSHILDRLAVHQPTRPARKEPPSRAHGRDLRFCGLALGLAR